MFFVKPIITNGTVSSESLALTGMISLFLSVTHKQFHILACSLFKKCLKSSMQCTTSLLSWKLLKTKCRPSFFKVNNKNTGKMCEICSKLIKTTKLRQWPRSRLFIVNFEHIATFVFCWLWTDSCLLESEALCSWYIPVYRLKTGIYEQACAGLL